MKPYLACLVQIASEAPEAPTRNNAERRLYSSCDHMNQCENSLKCNTRDADCYSHHYSLLF